MKQPGDRKSVQELLTRTTLLGFEYKAAIAPTDAVPQRHAVDKNSSVLYVQTDQDLYFNWGEDNTVAIDAAKSFTLKASEGIHKLIIPTGLGPTPNIVFQVIAATTTADVRLAEG